MFVSEYSMDIYKFVKIDIRKVTKNPELLKLVPDYLRTKKKCVSMQLKNYLF